MSNPFLPYILPREGQIDPVLRDRFGQMAQDFYEQTGQPLKVTDSFRSDEEQADVYRRKPELAAPAGQSKHNRKGVAHALDLDTNQVPKVEELGLLNKYGFSRPVLHKGEIWHIELDQQAGDNPFLQTEKRMEATAASVNNPFLQESGVKEDNPFLSASAETTPATTALPTEVLPGMAESGYPPSPAEKSASEMAAGMEDIRHKLASVINWPHEKVSGLLGKLGIPEQQITPVEAMLRPGEFGQVGGEPIQGELTSPLRETITNIIDPLTYSGVSKLFGLPGAAGRLFKPGVDAAAVEAELAALTKGRNWDSAINKVVQPVEELRGQQLAERLGRTDVEAETALQRLRGETNPTVAVEPFQPEIATKTTEQLAQELSDIEVMARAKQPLAMSEAGQIGGPIMQPGETVLTPKASTLPPEPTKIISPTQSGPFQESGVITPSPRATVEVTPAGETKIVPTEIPSIGTGERGKLTKMYSGGPEFDEFMNSINKFAAQPGSSYTIALARAASAHGMNVGEATDALRRGSLVRNNPAENLASQVFPVNKPITDFRSYHEVQMQGVPIVKPGQTEFAAIGPSKISPEVPTPMRNVSTAEAQIGADTISRNVFGDKNNLVGDYFQSINHYRENTRAGWTVLDNLAADTGLHLNIDASRIAVEERLFPVLEKYREAVSAQRQLYAEVQTKQNILKRLDISTTEAQRLEAEIADLTKQIHESPAVAQAITERNNVVSELASEHSNVRIFLGAERSGIPLNPDEQKAATAIRGYLDQTKERMQSLGMKTFSSGDKAYMPYMYGGTSDTSWFLGKRKGYPEFMDFLSRTPGSESWFPLAYQSMRQYIPAVEKKLAFNPLTIKWSPAIQSWKQGEFPGTADWAAKFLGNNLAPERMDFIDKAITFAVGTEYARTLWGNLAPALLHAFKVLVNVGYQGGEATVKGAGMFGKALAQKLPLIGGGGQEQQILDHYLMGKELMSGIYQSRGLEEMLKPNWWQTVKAGINLPLQLSEYVGNGLNVFSSIARGMKAGAPAETINREVLETMLRLDYRGFVMPPILTSTKAKPLTMYLGQPAKRLEGLIDVGIKAGKELAYPVSKQLESAGLIERALMEPSKNMFGESYLPKFVRIMALLGVGQQVGEHYGLDLSKHLLHLPGSGYAKDTGEHTISVQTPPIELASQFAEKGISEGLRQHYGWAAPMKFFQEPTSKFDNNLLMQVLGVPKYGWQEEAQGRAALRKMKELRSHPIKSMQLTPLEKLVGEVWD